MCGKNVAVRKAKYTLVEGRLGIDSMEYELFEWISKILRIRNRDVVLREVYSWWILVCYT